MVSSRLPLEKGKEVIILRWRRGDVTPGRKSGALGTTRSTLANNRGQTGIHNRENLSMRIAVLRGRRRRPAQKLNVIQRTVGPFTRCSRRKKALRQLTLLRKTGRLSRRATCSKNQA